MYGDAGYFIVPLFVIALSLCVWITTFLHELGHALVALWLTDDSVMIRMGSAPTGWMVRRGRLAVVIRIEHGLLGVVDWPLNGWRKAACHVAGWDKTSKGSKVLIILAGPFATLLQALLLSGLLWLMGEWCTSRAWLAPTTVVVAIVVCEWIAVVANLLPWKPPRGMVSTGVRGTDGWMVLHALFPTVFH